ncbi:MAG: hypothetical protein NZ455_16460 [Bacteroidia bacterium]|nr:hypothetical protein [Bacteroidia bacterium]MDW8348440.1 hypothetical protein [Bacteroidia bacterium]
MDTANKYIQQIKDIFEQEKDRYAAHKTIQPIMAKLTQDKQFLHDIIKKSLSDPEFIAKVRHYPTLSMYIYKDKNIDMNAHIFMPLPDQNTDITFQSIHHHGNLLLTTAAAFGPGYESILFKKGFTLDMDTQIATMQVEKIYQFRQGEVEFVDAFQPHVVFFPKDVSITYVVWSNQKPEHATAQSLKQNPLIRKFKKPIKKVLHRLGLSQKMGINVVEYYDFYPENGKIKALKHRIEFEHGDNQNFLTNFFHVMQKVGFQDTDFLSHLAQKYPQNSTLQTLVQGFVSGEPIPAPFYESHRTVRYVNLHREEIMKAIHS